MPETVFDNNYILDDCFERLCKVNIVKRKCKKPNDINGEYIDIWLVETEVEVFGKSTDISYYLCFKKSFPHSLPKVVLDKYNLPFKYMPHVEQNNIICLFEDNINYETDNPYELIRICIQKANKTIKEGYEEMNISHFYDEIMAYWDITYPNEKNVKVSFIHSFNEYPKTNCLLNIIKQTKEVYGGYEYVLYDSDKQNLVEFFTEHKKGDFIVKRGLFIADFKIADKPPYSISNGHLIDMLSPSSKRDFVKYINSKEDNNKYIFFYLNDNGLIGGLQYSRIKTDLKGFRPGVLSPYDILTNQLKSQNIQRLLSVEYSNKRIEHRTSGRQNKRWKFLIVGLGSVGSHLSYFLNNINYPEFTFVDNDILSIDNIGRHLLGYQDVHKAKIQAMLEYIKNIRPDQKVRGIFKTLEEYIIKNTEDVNCHDYIFIAIGNKQTEDFVIKMLVEEKVNAPVFILWVEAYLASGQCLYLIPQDAHKYNDLFCNSLYNHHVICADEYTNFEESKLKKRDAGCQSSYSPYSGNDITLFLSALYPHINNVLNGVQSKSFRFSWIGNIDKISELGINISDGFSSKDSFTNKLIEL